MIAIYNTEGDLQCKYNYDAWGNHRIGNARNELIYDSATGVIATGYESHIAILNPIRYRGYYYDTETGLYYLQSRYYDATLCRFLNRDNVNYLEPESIHGLNLYTYCNNNPIMFADPSGHFAMPNWLKWLIGGVCLIGGAVLCFIPGGQGLGVSLLVAGISATASNIMSAVGVDSKTACLISSGLNVIGGIVLCFTPFSGVGANMIGSGIGGIAGGYLSEVFGGSFEFGAGIGNLIGGIIGGKIYDYIKFSKIAQQGILIGKAGEFETAAMARNLAHYDGMPGYNAIKKISPCMAKRLGWADNYHYVNNVIKRGGSIYNLGGPATGSYGKELELIGDYIRLINL